VIIETLQSLMMCTLKYNQITLSEIRPEKRRTWHCGAETAWCVYEKAEFGVLDEDTTYPRDIHRRWTIQSTLVVLNLSLVPERGTEGDPPSRNSDPVSHAKPSCRYSRGRRGRGRWIIAQLVLLQLLFPENTFRGEEILETDLFSLNAVNRDIRAFISALPARGLPSLASTLSNTTYQPENSCIGHATFMSSSEGLMGVTENPIAKVTCK
jgi:hypothetical protein